MDKKPQKDNETATVQVEVKKLGNKEKELL